MHNSHIIKQIDHDKWKKKFEIIPYNDLATED